MWDLLARSGGVSQPSLNILHIPAEPSAWERAAPSDHRSQTHAGLLMTRLPAGESNIWSKNSLIYLLVKYEPDVNLHSPPFMCFLQAEWS